MKRRLRNLFFVFIGLRLDCCGIESGNLMLNTSESQFSRGRAPKVLTQVYSQEREWIVVKLDGVNAEGIKFKTTNRYKWDGKEYLYESAVAGTAKVAARKIEGYAETDHELCGPPNRRADPRGWLFCVALRH